MPEARIRPARLTGSDNEIDAILELMRVSMGDGPSRTKAFFTWKHLRNPFGPSLVWVAERDGMLVGLRAMMRWNLVSRGRHVRAVRPVDTATHPNNRRRGLFRRLTIGMVEALGSDGIELIFNTPNEHSGAGYLKMGWRQVGRAMLFMRPGGRFARRRTAPQPGQLAMGRALPHERRLHTELTQAYLQWRYTPPGALAYTQYGSGAPGVVLRRRERGGRNELAVSNLVVPSRREIQATASCLRSAVAASSDDYCIAMAGLFTREAAALHLAGFVPVGHRGPNLMVRSVPGQRPPVCAALSDWRLQIGDLEVF